MKGVQVVKKERERTTPGRVRWMYEGLLGRARARLALDDTASDASAADARAATVLCPLDATAWEVLAAAASAGGDEATATNAEAEAERRRPLE